MIKYKKYIKILVKDNDGVIPVYVHGKHASEKQTANTVVSEATWPDYAERKKYANVGELHDRLGEHYKYHPNDEYHISDYTSDSSDLNTHLLSNYDNGIVLSPSKKKRATSLSSIISNKPAPESFHVHTGLGFNPANHLTKDNKLKSPAFLSSSIHPPSAESFATPDEQNTKNQDGTEVIRHVKHLMRINVPKGSTHGAYIAHHSELPGEQEFLFNKGTTFKVNPKPLKIYDRNGNHTHSIWRAHPTDERSDSPHFDKEEPTDPKEMHHYLHSLMDSPHTAVLADAIRHPKADVSVIEKALRPHMTTYIRGEAARHRLLTPKHIEHILKNDPSHDVRFDAASNRNASKENLDLALKDHSPVVRSGAIQNNNATQEHIKRGLVDPSEHVVHVSRRIARDKGWD